jgi:hypothetical protein
MKEITLLVVCWLPFLLQAQSNVTLSGRITDGSSGEDLIGATVVLADQPSIGAMTNIYGFYSLTVEAGTYELSFQYLGYQSQSVTIELNGLQAFGSFALKNPFPTK